MSAFSTPPWFPRAKKIFWLSVVFGVVAWSLWLLYLKLCAEVASDPAARALLVSGVETVWSGVEIPAYADRITRKDWRGKNITLERFAEMARFNYGSTVVVLLPQGVAASAEAVSPPAVEKANGKLLAPNTATGPSATWYWRRSARGKG